MKLSDRVEKLTGPDNEIDVLVEVALFDLERGPYVACRSNDAGTKVIYAYKNGDTQTYWAGDWTENLEQTAAILRARGL